MLLKAGDEALEEFELALLKPAELMTLKSFELLCPVPVPARFGDSGWIDAKRITEESRKPLGCGYQNISFGSWNKQTTCLAGPFDEIDPGVKRKKLRSTESELG